MPSTPRLSRGVEWADGPAARSRSKKLLAESGHKKTGTKSGQSLRAHVQSLPPQDGLSSAIAEGFTYVRGQDVLK